TVVGYALTPTDCGGFAVVQVGTLKFLLPKDGTAAAPANGLPDAWEALYGGALDPAADIDTGPLATSPCCDGISNADEYRAVVVRPEERAPRAAPENRVHPSREPAGHSRRGAAGRRPARQLLPQQHREPLRRWEQDVPDAHGAERHAHAWRIEHVHREHRRVFHRPRPRRAHRERRRGRAGRGGQG